MVLYHSCLRSYLLRITKSKPQHVGLSLSTFSNLAFYNVYRFTDFLITTDDKLFDEYIDKILILICDNDNGT